MAKKEERKPITNAEVLRSQGIIEITNPDGSKSQMSEEQAKARIAELKAITASMPDLSVEEKE